MIFAADANGGELAVKMSPSEKAAQLATEAQVLNVLPALETHYKRMRRTAGENSCAEQVWSKAVQKDRENDCKAL